MKKAKIRKYAIIGAITTVMGILSFFVYQSYAYYKVNYTGNIINTTVAPFGSYEYVYTGTVQEFTVPATGYYEIELWGARGGSMATFAGGTGGYSKGIISLNKDEKIYFYLGGVPTNNIGGYNGGGTNNGGQYSMQYGSAGGGSTDIRLVNGAWDDSASLRSRIMVAGGGAGVANRGQGYGDGVGGVGGNLIGGNGQVVNSTNGYGNWPGIGGSQVTGGSIILNNGTYLAQITSINIGSFGKGANGFATSGGSGYYGGGGQAHAGGGGGSSYISGYAGVNSVQETGGTAVQPLHTNNTIHYSGKYFIKGSMQAGINTGNGKAKITFIGSTIPERTNTKLDNVRYIKQCQTSDTSAETTRHWVEIQAIKDGLNVAYGKPVIGTVTEYVPTPYSRIVDGNINTNAWSWAGVAGGPQCVTVDLGEEYDLDEVGLWLYWGDGRKYNGNVLSVGSTTASGTTSLSTILHNYSGTTPYSETSQGKRYSAWD